MRGCAACARQTITQFKGEDEELVALFHDAQAIIRDNVALPGNAGGEAAARPA
jgi:hypothetical protein